MKSLYHQLISLNEDTVLRRNIEPINTTQINMRVLCLLAFLQVTSFAVSNEVDSELPSRKHLLRNTRDPQQRSLQQKEYRLVKPKDRRVVRKERNSKLAREDDGERTEVIPELERASNGGTFEFEVDDEESVNVVVTVNVETTATEEEEPSEDVDEMCPEWEIVYVKQIQHQHHHHASKSGKGGKSSKSTKSHKSKAGKSVKEVPVKKCKTTKPTSKPAPVTPMPIGGAVRMLQLLYQSHHDISRAQELIHMYFFIDSNSNNGKYHSRSHRCTTHINHLEPNEGWRQYHVNPYY